MGFAGMLSSLQNQRFTINMNLVGVFLFIGTQA